MHGDGSGVQIPETAELIMEVHAPEEFHRFLIGARGATMKQIQNESDALIFFPNTKNAPARVKPSSENVVTIVGTKLACERAQELIIARVEDCHKEDPGVGASRDSSYLKLLHYMRDQRQQVAQQIAQQTAQHQRQVRANPGRPDNGLSPTPQQSSGGGGGGKPGGGLPTSSAGLTSASSEAATTGAPSATAPGKGKGKSAGKSRSMNGFMPSQKGSPTALVVFREGSVSAPPTTNNSRSTTPTRRSGSNGASGVSSPGSSGGAAAATAVATAAAAVISHTSGVGVGGISAGFKCEVQVQVPAELHGFVVGGRGFVLKEIQTESGARVYLPTTKTAPARARAAGKDVITILGSQRACDIAQDLVLARAEDAENGRRSKEDSAYMNLLHQLREQGRTTSHHSGHGGHPGPSHMGGYGLDEQGHAHMVGPRWEEHHGGDQHPHMDGGMDYHHHSDAAMHAHARQQAAAMGVPVHPGDYGAGAMDHSMMLAHSHQHYLHEMQGVETMGHSNPWADPMHIPGMQHHNGAMHPEHPEHPQPHVAAGIQMNADGTPAQMPQMTQQMTQQMNQQMSHQMMGDSAGSGWGAMQSEQHVVGAWQNPQQGHSSDELGAAAAWSAAPPRDPGCPLGAFIAQDIRHMYPQPANPAQMLADQLYGQLCDEGQVQKWEVARIMQMLLEMPIQGLKNAVTDADYRGRMVARCQHSMQQQQQHVEYQSQQQPAAGQQSPQQWVEQDPNYANEPHPEQPASVPQSPAH